MLGLGYDGLVGYSPIAMAKNAVGLAIAAEEYGAKFFANGAAPGGVLEHPGTIKDPERIRQSWQSTFGGSANSNKIAVLEEGLKYTPIAISPEQAQFLETRKSKSMKSLEFPGACPAYGQILRSRAFQILSSSRWRFVKYTLAMGYPLEQAMNKSLLFDKVEKRDVFTKFNRRTACFARLCQPHERLRTARQNGWMSANESPRA